MGSFRRSTVSASPPLSLRVAECWALPRGKQNEHPNGLYECADLPAMNRGSYNFGLQWSAGFCRGE